MAEETATAVGEATEVAEGGKAAETAEARWGVREGAAALEVLVAEVAWVVWAAEEARGAVAAAVMATGAVAATVGAVGTGGSMAVGAVTADRRSGWPAGSRAEVVTVVAAEHWVVAGSAVVVEATDAAACAAAPRVAVEVLQAGGV